MTLALAGAQAGTLGLLIVLLLGVGTYFLLRSLNTQLRKVPRSFDEPVQRRGRRAVLPVEPADPGPADNEPADKEPAGEEPEVVIVPYVPQTSEPARPVPPDTAPPATAPPAPPPAPPASPRASTRAPSCLLDVVTPVAETRPEQ